MTGAMRDALELIRSRKKQYPDETSAQNDNQAEKQDRVHGQSPTSLD